MKQYIMGMITGASLLACAFIFMGQADSDSQNGRYQISVCNRGGVNWLFYTMIDTKTGETYRLRDGGWEKKKNSHIIIK